VELFYLSSITFRRLELHCSPSPFKLTSHPTSLASFHLSRFPRSIILIKSCPYEKNSLIGESLCHDCCCFSSLCQETSRFSGLVDWYAERSEEGIWYALEVSGLNAFCPALYKLKKKRSPPNRLLLSIQIKELDFQLYDKSRTNLGD